MLGHDRLLVGQNRSWEREIKTTVHQENLNLLLVFLSFLGYWTHLTPVRAVYFISRDLFKCVFVSHLLLLFVKWRSTDIPSPVHDWLVKVQPERRKNGAYSSADGQVSRPAASAADSAQVEAENAEEIVATGSQRTAALLDCRSSCCGRCSSAAHGRIDASAAIATPSASRRTS